MPIHVSIHDVAPPFERQIDAALSLAGARGIKPALLVVPDFHGSAPLAHHPAFCEKLRTLEAEGHEIYLHGYYHRARPWGEHHRATMTTAALSTGIQSWPARARYAFSQQVVSNGEAEFRDVSRAEAMDRLDRGEHVLRQAGLTIRGFVAPAWSMPAWFREILSVRGYAFAEDHLRVYAPASRASRPSVVFNYASRSVPRLLSTVAFCRLARPAGRLMPARVAIHPADMEFMLLRSETVRLLDWAKGDLAVRGQDLLVLSPKRRERLKAREGERGILELF